ncbi:MAG: glycosyltransferase family 25 protein [Treponema sp.]|nr:glycosyltransferase family 25 protein [Treponema sp.]
MKIFIINLLKNADRREFIKLQFNNFNNITYEYFNAVDGRNLTNHELNYYYDKEKAIKTYKELSLGEIGCSLSHKFIWKKMVEENIERAVIFEDDVTIKPDFFNILEKLENIKINKLIVKLEKCFWREQNEDNVKVGRFTPWHIIKLNNDFFIGQPRISPCLTWGYYIDLEAAKTLCNIYPKVYLVSDAWYYFRKYINLRMLNIPVITNNDDLFSSAIDGIEIRDFENNKKTIIDSVKLNIIQKYIKKIKTLIYIIYLFFK